MPFFKKLFSSKSSKDRKPKSSGDEELISVPYEIPEDPAPVARAPAPVRAPTFPADAATSSPNAATSSTNMAAASTEAPVPLRKVTTSAVKPVKAPTLPTKAKAPTLPTKTKAPTLLVKDKDKDKVPTLPAKAKAPTLPAKDKDKDTASALPAKAKAKASTLPAKAKALAKVSSPGTATKLQKAPVPKLWRGLNAFQKVMGHATGSLGPLKAVVDELVECVEIYEKAASGREEYKILRKELEGIFEELMPTFSRPMPLDLTLSAESLCSSIQHELERVRRKQSKEGLVRYLEAANDAERVLVSYRRIHGHLQRLSLNVNLTMWATMDDMATENRLKQLTFSASACYNSAKSLELKRGPVSEGTRVDVIKQMLDWVHNGSGSVYWMSGMAGTGKTTIAYSLCVELESDKRLAASFFCSRLLSECRDVNLIIPSIAYQLARASQPFRFALSQVLAKEPDAHTRLPQIQFDILIAGPLSEIRETLPGNMVVMIDALDECENKESASQILGVLLAKSSELPIKFIVSSRPEAGIRDQMEEGENRVSSGMVLHELDKASVQADIEAYLRASLKPMSPTESQIASLVEHAGILFIYAATAVRYIGYDNFRRNPRTRLETVLNAKSSGSTKHKEIDELYRTVLMAAFEDPGLDETEIEDMKQVLYTVICTREPLTIWALSTLLKLDDLDRVRAALRPLWSVLHVAGSSELVTTLHASFPEYMLDPSRSKEYSCDRKAHNTLLARCCFDCIRDADPQFNVCGLESSYVPDERVEDLEERTQKIPMEFFYSCRYWATHLSVANESAGLVEQLEEFLSTRLLLWMEVMNVKKCMYAGPDMILMAEDWSGRQNCSQELEELIRDAWRFTARFASNSVSQSTPHIYMSMLPFWPQSDPISQHYASRCEGAIKPEGTAINRQQKSALLATWTFGKYQATESASFSPDGTRIVFCLANKIYVLDASSGRVVLEPFEAHESNVMSAQFSPDGTRIASGAHDDVVRLWDARTGELVLGPFVGHTGSVSSVVFSPDGSRIVSGAHDGTIRLWDSQTGQSVLDPLQGHTDRVNSVGISPNGTMVVSCSDDKTIRLWNVRTGQPMFSPIEGHTRWITSVMFSPDGARIVSGSGDSTIRVWDIKSRKTVLGPLEGHTDPISSVAYSPDGKRLISASDDATLRMWDAKSGEMILGPLKGHDSQLRLTRFSPDGARIVSGSFDGTVRLWDARTAQTADSLLQGHTEAILSVAFSPDGTRIASSSIDKTVCLWDAKSGEMILGPLELHTDWVKSVAFSPDGAYIASGSEDKTVVLWNAQSGEVIHGPLKGEDAFAVNAVQFSPNGTRLASGSGTSIHIWDVQSGQMALEPFKGHRVNVLSVAFSPDGARIASCGGDETICLWNSENGEIVLGPLKGHTHWINSIAFSPDGSQLVSGSSDQTIRLWDLSTGDMVLTLQGHPHWVTSVSFSPNGAYILSASCDETIRLWDARTGNQVLGPLRGHTNYIHAAAFSPDGTRIVSGGDDKTIQVFDIQDLDSSSQSHQVPEWEMDKHGWVVDGQSRLLGWVPNDFRCMLMWPRTALMISAEGNVRLNFNDARLGEPWTECYQPA